MLYVDKVGTPYNNCAGESVLMCDGNQSADIYTVAYISIFVL